MMISSTLMSLPSGFFSQYYHDRSVRYNRLGVSDPVSSESVWQFLRGQKYTICDTFLDDGSELRHFVPSPPPVRALPRPFTSDKGSYWVVPYFGPASKPSPPVYVSRSSTVLTSIDLSDHAVSTRVNSSWTPIALPPQVEWFPTKSDECFKYTPSLAPPLRFPRAIAYKRKHNSEREQLKIRNNTRKRVESVSFKPHESGTICVLRECKAVRSAILFKQQNSHDLSRLSGVIDDILGDLVHQGLFDGPVGSISDAVTASIDKASASVSEAIGNGLNSFTETINTNINRQIKVIGDAAQDWIVRLGAVIAVIVIIYWLSQSDFDTTLVTLVITLAGVAIAMFLGDDIHKKVWPLVLDLTKKIKKNVSDLFGEDLEPQGLTDNIPSIPAILTTLLSCYLIGSAYSGPSLTKQILSSTSMYSNVVRGFKDFFSDVGGAVVDIVNAVLGYFGAKHRFTWYSADKEINEWCDRVNSVYLRYRVSDVQLSSDDLDTLIILRREAATLSDKHRNIPSLNVHIVRMTSAIDQMLDTYGPAMVANRGNRVQPVSVFFQGSPGCGKTVAMKALAAHIVYSYLTPEALAGRGKDLSRHIYVKSKDPYFTGYNMQTVWMQDDIFQDVNSAGDVDNDFRALIDIVNPFVHPLRMAAIADKGKVYMNSPAFIATTNLDNFSHASQNLIRDQDAVLRRMHHCVRLIPAAHMIDGQGKFDYNKYIAATPAQKHVAWNVATIDFADPETTKKNSALSIDVRSFATFADEVVAHMVHNREIDAQSRVCDSDMAEYLIARAAAARLTHQSGLDSFDLGMSSSVSDSDTEVFDLTDDSLFTRFKNYGLELVEKVKSSKTYAFLTSATGKMCLLGALASVGLLIHCLSKNNKKNTDRTITGDSESRNKKQKQKKEVVTVKTGEIVEEKLVYNGLAESSVARRRATSNSYDIHVLTGDDELRLGSCLFIKGNIAIMPNHYTLQITNHSRFSEMTKVVFRPSFGNFRAFFHMDLEDFLNTSKFHVDASRDFMALQVPNITAHRDITKFFIEKSDLQVFNHRFVPLTVDFVDWENDSHVIKRHHTNTILELGPRMVNGVNNDAILPYCAKSVSGDCGAVVYFENMGCTMQRQIVGLHVAGNSVGTGACNVITRNMIDHVCARFQPVSDECFPDVEVVDSVGLLAHEGFETLAKASRPMNLNRNTTLRPSKIVWPRVTQPAMMYPKKNINPMANAMAGYAGDVVSIRQSKLDQASIAAFRPFMETSIGHRRKVLTAHDAIVSTLDNKGIPRSTSAGYPCCSLGITKKLLWGRDGDYDFTSKAHRDLMREVDYVLDMAKQNKRCLHIFADFLKDELRSPEKVATGKTRLVAACPILYNILCRMYFLDFTNAVQATRIHNSVCVGINAYREWTGLAENLLRKGNNIIAGDFSGFDKAQVPQITWSILDRINEWYGDSAENQRVRRVLWYEVLHSRHIGGDGFTADVIYQWHKSLPSGHPLTSFINSFYNLTIIACCWYDHASVLYPNNMWEIYRLHVQPQVYGDDNLIAVSDTLARSRFPFDQIALTNYMKNVGMTYTNEKKDGDIFSYRPIEDVEFLKRSFNKVISNGKVAYLPSLRLESVIQMTLWERSEMSDKDMWITFNTFFCELSLHDAATWHEYSGAFAQQAGVHYGYTVSALGIPFKQESLRAFTSTIDPKY
jgi:hypothetical protein